MTGSKTAAGNDPAASAKDPGRGGQPLGELRIVAVSAISEAPALAWDACANPAVDPGCPAPGAAHSSDQEIPHNPFLSHAFLSALETSKSVGARAGWQVQHLLVHAADGTLVAAAPCYLKSHSRGE